jgi:hypothetical protein
MSMLRWAGREVLDRRHEAVADRRGAFPNPVLDQGLVGGTLNARDHRRDRPAANPMSTTPDENVPVSTSVPPGPALKVREERRAPAEDHRVDHRTCSSTGP